MMEKKATITTGNSRDKQMSKTAQKVLTIIEAMATVESSGFITLIELSAKTQINKTIVYRILNTLIARGYVEKIDSKYRLGLKFLHLAMSSIRYQSLVDLVRPHLVELSSRIKERAFLSLADGHEIVQIDKVEGNPTLRVVSEIGSRFPLYCTASGKLYLAFLPEDEREKLLEQVVLRKLTDFTITSKKQLLMGLEKVRMSGFAVSDREYHDHESAVAAPLLKNHETFIAAIGLAGSSVTFTPEKMEDSIPLLHEHAEKISAALTLREEEG